MVITIRDKHLGDEIDYDGFLELYTDSVNIHVYVVSKDGWTNHHTFSKKDYEIRYIV